MSEPNPPRRPLATFLRPLPGAPADAADPVHARTLRGNRTPAAEDGHGSGAPDTTEVPAPYADQAEGVIPRSKPARAAARPPAAAAIPASRSDAAAATATHTAAAEPGFLRGRATRSSPPRRYWLAVAGLLGLLGLQIALADRDRLAANATTRPWIGALCTALRCTVPAWREPDAFVMTSREVRPVPGQPGALQVQASLRNDARWAQAWPTLRLSLSDSDGRVVGTGVFTPADYLGTQAAGRALLEPGQSAQIAFRVREPAASTLAFTFEFM